MEIRETISTLCRVCYTLSVSLYCYPSYFCSFSVSCFFPPLLVLPSTLFLSHIPFCLLLEREEDRQRDSEELTGDWWSEHFRAVCLHCNLREAERSSHVCIASHFSLFSALYWSDLPSAKTKRRPQQLHWFFFSISGPLTGSGKCLLQSPDFKHFGYFLTV